MKRTIDAAFFQDVQSMLDILTKYRKVRTVKVLSDQQALIKQLYQTVSPHGQQFYENCSECVMHSLNTLESWYSREYPKWYANQIKATPVVETIDVPQTMVDVTLTPDDMEEPAPKVKRTRKKKDA